MAPPPEPAGLPGLVALMYQADWTALSLAATVTCRTDRDLRARKMGGQPHRPSRAWRVDEDGSCEPPEPTDGPVSEVSYRLLLAPGGKYRISQGTGPGQLQEVCDGETAWVIVPERLWETGETEGETAAAHEAETGDATGQPPVSRQVAVRRPAAGPGSPFEELLIPATLLSRYTLGPAGTMGADSETGGRAAHRVVARSRPIPALRLEKAPGQVAALVDAELGILLRTEETYAGQPLKVTELSGVQCDPPEAGEPGQFRPPPDLPVREAGIPFRSPGISLPGRGGDAVRAAAGLTAAVMGFAVRRWPSPGRPAGEGEAGPMPGRDGPMAATLEPADDDLINLLHRTGRPHQAFTAEVHEWLDGDLFTRAGARFRESLPPAVDGILGPDAVWDAMASRATIICKVTRLRLAAPGRYRIDMLAGGSPADPQTIACDGERQWLVRGPKVTYRDAMPLARELARLADPAWLLARFTLRAGGEIEVGDRRGLVVVGDRGADRADEGWMAAGATGADRARAGRPGVRDPEELDIAWLDGLVSRVEAVVDPELAVLLRVESFAGDRPVLCHELRGLVPGGPDPGLFEVPPGARRSGPLEGFGMLSPGTAVKAAAGLGMVGAAGLVGWLQKRPRG